MNATPEEIRCARPILAELSTGEAEQLRQDPACAGILQQMQETVEVLRAWPSAHVMTLRPPSRTSWRWIAACAAAVLVALAVSHFVPARRDGIAVDLAWTSEVPTTDTVNLAERPPSRYGGGPSRGGGASKGGDGGPQTEGGLPEWPALKTFSRQFSFRFRVPPVAPGNYAIDRGRRVSPDRAWLIYRRGDLSFNVYLSCSPGPDRPLEETSIGDRRLAACRTNGVLIAFDADVVSPPQREAFVRQLEAGIGE